MKILGTKFYQHNSAICLLDFDQHEIFTMSTERVTRIKSLLQNNLRFFKRKYQLRKTPRGKVIAQEPRVIL